MRPSLFAVIVVMACSSPPSEPPANAPKPVDEQTRLRELAVRFTRAAIDGKRAEARALVLTPQQFRTISIYPTPDARYLAELGSALDVGARIKTAFKWRDVDIEATTVDIEDHLPGPDSAVRAHTRFAKVRVNLNPRDLKCDSTDLTADCIAGESFVLALAMADGIDWACWPEIGFPQPQGGRIFQDL